jgi:hypothetical protein
MYPADRGLTIGNQLTTFIEKDKPREADISTVDKNK